MASRCCAAVTVVLAAVLCWIAATGYHRAVVLHGDTAPGVVPALPWTAHAINAVGDLLQAIGVPPPQLEAKALLQHAVDTTGLHDFGTDMFPDQFEASLQAFCEAVEEEEEEGGKANSVPFLGRITLHRFAQRSVINRLQIVHLLKQHPDIAARPVDAPIFVVGLPRSGTSAFFNVLSAHPAVAPLTSAEGAMPAGLPGVPLTQSYLDTHVDPRIAVIDRELMMAGLAVPPTFAGVHDISASQAEEDVLLFQQSFSTSVLDTISDTPRYRQYLHTLDHGPAYLLHKRHLQLLQWQRSQPLAQRWILKTPIHIEFLPELFEQYPDAKLVWMHRDPAQSMKSMMSMQAHLYAMTTSTVVPQHVGNVTMARYTTASRRALAHRRSLKHKDAFVDVLYTEFIKDPVGTACRVAAKVGLPSCEEDGGAKRSMAAWVASHPQGKRGVHEKPPLTAYGWSREQVLAAFAEHVEFMAML